MANVGKMVERVNKRGKSSLERLYKKVKGKQVTTKRAMKILPTVFRNFDDALEVNELNKGVIRLTEDIGSYEAGVFMRSLDYLRDIEPKKTTVHIVSPGGSVYHALAMYDEVVDYAKTHKVEAIVEGYAASAASMIFLQAFPKRYARPNARFLLHEPRKFNFGVERASDAEDNVKEMGALSDTITDILAKRCSISKADLKKIIDRKESWLSAEEALKIGLIDAIK